MIDSSNIGTVLTLLEKEYKQNRIPIISQISERDQDPFRILIGTILSLRTKDEVTAKGITKNYLKLHLP